MPQRIKEQNEPSRFNCPTCVQVEVVSAASFSSGLRCFLVERSPPSPRRVVSAVSSSTVVSAVSSSSRSKSSRPGAVIIVQRHCFKRRCPLHCGSTIQGSCWVHCSDRRWQRRRRAMPWARVVAAGAAGSKNKCWRRIAHRFPWCRAQQRPANPGVRGPLTAINMAASVCDEARPPQICSRNVCVFTK